MDRDLMKDWYNTKQRAGRTHFDNQRISINGTRHILQVDSAVELPIIIADRIR